MAIASVSLIRISRLKITSTCSPKKSPFPVFKRWTLTNQRISSNAAWNSVSIPFASKSISLYMLWIFIWFGLVFPVNNADYWKDRFGQLEAAQNQKGADTYEEIEKIYRQAQREIEGKINTWYHRFAENNGISMTEARKMLFGADLKEFKWDVHDYIRYGEENAVSQAWMKELENASAKSTFVCCPKFFRKNSSHRPPKASLLPSQDASGQALQYPSQSRNLFGVHRRCDSIRPGWNNMKSWQCWIPVLLKSARKWMVKYSR